MAAYENWEPYTIRLYHINIKRHLKQYWVWYGPKRLKDGARRHYGGWYASKAEALEYARTAPKLGPYAKIRDHCGRRFK